MWRWTKRTVIGCLTCRSNGLMGGPWPMKATIHSRPSAVSLKVWLRETRISLVIFPTELPRTGYFENPSRSAVSVIFRPARLALTNMPCSKSLKSSLFLILMLILDFSSSSSPCLNKMLPCDWLIRYLQLIICMSLWGFSGLSTIFYWPFAEKNSVPCSLKSQFSTISEQCRVQQLPHSPHCFVPYQHIWRPEGH